MAQFESSKGWPADSAALEWTTGGVAYVLDDFPIRSERFIEREVSAMRRMGIRLPLCLLRAERSSIEGPRYAEIHRSGGPAHALPALARAVSSWALARAEKQSGRHARRASWDAARWGPVAAQFAGLLAPRPPRLIHAHFATIPALVAKRMAAELRLPWGVSVHAQDVYAQPAELLAARLQGAAYVLACSPAAAQAVRERVGERTPVHVVRHGLDLDDWVFEERAFTRERAPQLLAVGRFVEKKNLIAVVEACALLSRSHPGLRCTLVGDGPLRRQLEQAIARTGAPVTLLPWQDERALAALYARATLLVAPGIVSPSGDRDNISNVILEAMACGVPVVSSQVSLESFGAEDAQSLITSDSSAQALAATISHALANPRLREEVCAKGRALIERRFDSRANVAQLVAIFSAAVQRFASAGDRDRQMLGAPLVPAIADDLLIHAGKAGTPNGRCV